MKNIVFNRFLKRSLAIITCSSLLLCVSLGVYADDVTVKQDHPERYTVIDGDTLWDISSRFLQDPWRWKDVWQGNSQITNPHLIYPGDVIRLLFVDGQPKLIAERSGANTPTPEGSQDSASSTPTDTAVPPVTSVETAPSNKPLKTVKLSPKIYSSPVTKQAIPAIPLENINHFLSGNRIMEESRLDEAAHVIAGSEQRVILGAGDTLYARGEFSSSSYGIYRKGQSYIDPETDDVLGIQALDVGSVRLRSINDDIGTFDIIRSTEEVRIGDRLIANEQRKITSTFLPTPPPEEVEGFILTVERGVSQVGKYDIVAVSLGKNKGIEQGHVLAVYKRGQAVRDRFAKKGTDKNLDLPEERSGLILVFQVFEKMSLGILLEAGKGITVKDIVRTP